LFTLYDGKYLLLNGPPKPFSLNNQSRVALPEKSVKAVKASNTMVK